MQIWKLFENIPSGFEKVFLAVDSYLEVPLNVREGNKQKQIKSRNSQIPWNLLVNTGSKTNMIKMIFTTTEVNKDDANFSHKN